MNVLAVIPARYQSTRFPGKPLADLAGKSMIQRVYEQVAKAEKVDSVIVATDDQRIFEHVKTFGQAMMTREDHQSGTDRCAEVAAAYTDFDLILNVQGDEPFIYPEQIDQLVTAFLTASQPVDIGTMVKKIEQSETLFNPNVVKVVRSRAGNGLYFSRHPIPYQRGKGETEWLSGSTYFKHLGIYLFRRQTLATICTLPVGTLETLERLEQLRWLEHGFSIYTVETKYETIGIDSPEDLEKALKLID